MSVLLFVSSAQEIWLTTGPTPAVPKGLEQPSRTPGDEALTWPLSRPAEPL